MLGEGGVREGPRGGMRGRIPSIEWRGMFMGIEHLASLTFTTPATSASAVLMDAARRAGAAVLTFSTPADGMIGAAEINNRVIIIAPREQRERGTILRPAAERRT